MKAKLGLKNRVSALGSGQDPLRTPDPRAPWSHFSSGKVGRQRMIPVPQLLRAPPLGMDLPQTVNSLCLGSLNLTSVESVWKSSSGKANTSTQALTWFSSIWQAPQTASTVGWEGVRQVLQALLYK